MSLVRKPSRGSQGRRSIQSITITTKIHTASGNNHYLTSPKPSTEPKRTDFVFRCQVFVFINPHTQTRKRPRRCTPSANSISSHAALPFSLQHDSKLECAIVRLSLLICPPLRVLIQRVTALPPLRRYHPPPQPPQPPPQTQPQPPNPIPNPSPSQKHLTTPQQQQHNSTSHAAAHP